MFTLDVFAAGAARLPGGVSAGTVLGKPHGWAAESKDLFTLLPSFDWIHSISLRSPPLCPSHGAKHGEPCVDSSAQTPGADSPAGEGHVSPVDVQSDGECREPGEGWPVPPRRLWAARTSEGGALLRGWIFSDHAPIPFFCHLCPQPTCAPLVPPTSTHCSWERLGGESFWLGHFPQLPSKNPHSGAPSSSPVSPPWSLLLVLLLTDLAKDSGDPQDSGLCPFISLCTQTLRDLIWSCAVQYYLYNVQDLQTRPRPGPSSKPRLGLQHLLHSPLQCLIDIPKLIPSFLSLHPRHPNLLQQSSPQPAQ